MTKEELERKKLFFELLKRVEKLKENSTGVYKYSNDIFEKATDIFENQNDKVFDINMYILSQLYTEEFEEIQKNNKFSLNDYYDLIERLDLPDIMYEAYIKMPKMISKNKILSYVTDIPSFISMIR